MINYSIYFHMRRVDPGSDDPLSKLYICLCQDGDITGEKQAARRGSSICDLMKPLVICFHSPILSISPITSFSPYQDVYHKLATKTAQENLLSVIGGVSLIRLLSSFGLWTV